MARGERRALRRDRVDAYRQPYIPFYLTTQGVLRGRARPPDAARDRDRQRRPPVSSDALEQVLTATLRVGLPARRARPRRGHEHAADGVRAPARARGCAPRRPGRAPPPLRRPTAAELWPPAARRNASTPTTRRRSSGSSTRRSSTTRRRERDSTGERHEDPRHQGFRDMQGEPSPVPPPSSPQFVPRRCVTNCVDEETGRNAPVSSSASRNPWFQGFRRRSRAGVAVERGQRGGAAPPPRARRCSAACGRSASGCGPARGALP